MSILYQIVLLDIDFTSTFIFRLCISTSNRPSTLPHLPWINIDLINQSTSDRRKKERSSPVMQNSVTEKVHYDRGQVTPAMVICGEIYRWLANQSKGKTSSQVENICRTRVYLNICVTSESRAVHSRAFLKISRVNTPWSESRLVWRGFTIRVQCDTYCEMIAAVRFFVTLLCDQSSQRKGLSKIFSSGIKEKWRRCSAKV